MGIGLITRGSVKFEANHVIRKPCTKEGALMKETLTFAKSFNKKRPILLRDKKRFYKNIIEILKRYDPGLI